MTRDDMPYGIGSDHWPGLAKLMEEMGELQQVLGKIMACEGPSAIYWDGNSLQPSLIEELGDVRAAMIFFCLANGISNNSVHDRVAVKLHKFEYWHEQHRTMAEAEAQEPGWMDGWREAMDWLTEYKGEEGMLLAQEMATRLPEEHRRD